HARRQRGRAALGQLAQDVRDLLGRLAFTEHDLGEARAQMPVRVDARKLERAERQLTQLLQSFRDRNAFAAHPFEKRLQTFRIHDACASHYNMEERVGAPRSGRQRLWTSACGRAFRMLATSVSSANGLRTSSLARGGRGTCSALSTMTGIRCSVWSLVSTCSTSQPETRGIIRSRITRSAPGGSFSVRKSIACLPLAAGMTSRPSLSSKSCRVSLTSRSSSTSRTLLGAIGTTLSSIECGE